jgi:hypothetical protein
LHPFQAEASTKPGFFKPKHRWTNKCRLLAGETNDTPLENVVINEENQPRSKDKDEKGDSAQVEPSFHKPFHPHIPNQPVESPQMIRRLQLRNCLQVRRQIVNMMDLLEPNQTHQRRAESDESNHV